MSELKQLTASDVIQTPGEGNRFDDRYICAHCSHQVGFSNDSFSRHCHGERQGISKLPEPCKSIFDQVRPIGDDFFLDFLCPGCESPVRLVFNYSSEEKPDPRADDYVEVLCALELKQSANHSP